MKRIELHGFIGAVLFHAAQAQATISQGIVGLAGTGVTADVDFTYTALSDATAKITVIMENTTPAELEGFITGFAFNIPAIDGVTILSIGGDTTTSGATELVFPNEPGWFSLLEFDGIKTPVDAGDFDIGILNASHQNAFITGGNGNDPHVLFGETTTFELDLLGLGLDNLTNTAFEAAFMSEFSTDRPSGNYNFAAKFQGIVHEQSDLAAVPDPSTLLLLFASLGISRLWKRS